MKINKNPKSGIAPLIILLIVTLLAGGGGATYLAVKGKPLSIDSVKENLLGGETKEEALENLSIDNADFDVSASPLPKLELNAFNLNVPSLATPKVGNINTSFSSNFSVDQSKINLGAPNLSNMMPQISIPSIPTGSIPSDITIPSGMPPLPTDMGGISVPPGTGAVPTESGSAPAGGQGGPTCASFGSIQACPFVPVEFQEACRACFQ